MLLPPLWVVALGLHDAPVLFAGPLVLVVLVVTLRLTELALQLGRETAEPFREAF